ncbi:MAG: caspase family protein [Thermoflexales bacterium]|nr:caspase family protein [Thermoflexales bacterium]
MTDQFTNGYALLIGVNENSVATWALPAVIKDINAVSTVLTHPERCAYPSDNVKTITGQAATRQGILNGLDWLQARIKADSSDNTTAIVYYTGHGLREGSGSQAEFFLVPYDFKEEKVKLSALRATDLAEAIGALAPRRLLVVLDCCHASGMGIKGALSVPAGYAQAAVTPLLLMQGEQAPVGPSAKGAKMETLALGKGRAVLSSSSGDQSSYIRKDGKMSIFTYHLIEALTGHAQPQEGAKEVLVSDVMSHVYRRVPDSAKKECDADQVPDFQISGNFPVALLLGGKGLSKGQPAPDPLAPIAAGSVTSVGGDSVGRDKITAGGDYVGRDKIVHGDEVHGDKVGGDKITVGNITGSTAVAIGRGARATVRQGLSGDEIAHAFGAIMRQVGALPAGADKDDAQDAVQKLEAEAHKGDQAEESRVQRLFRTLAETAPDAWQVAVDTFINPIKGMSTAFQKIAQRAKEERKAEK